MLLFCDDSFEHTCNLLAQYSEVVFDADRVDESAVRRYTGFKPAQCAGRRRRENGVAVLPPG
jgi:hypothetical protein